jgi:hypothetical protein
MLIFSSNRRFILSILPFQRRKRDENKILDEASTEQFATFSGLPAPIRDSKRIRVRGRLKQLCTVLLMLLSVYALFSMPLAVVVETPNLGSLRTFPLGSSIIEPPGPLFHPTLKRAKTNGDGDSGTKQQPQQTQHHHHHDGSSRVLILASAPRSAKHIVALWSSLECFTSDVDHVAISSPTWSRPILERLLVEATLKIPRFASGSVSLEGMVTVNDRYDVGLWCDALSRMNAGDANSPHDKIALLNDSVFALREYTEIFGALGKASMTSLNYSFIHPKGTGDEFYWLESVWRGFDRVGIRTFAAHSCRPPDDPLFCQSAWWGRKGCIVENFERAMAKQFPREKTVGLFPSDVPKEMLTRKDSFPSWVRHPPYWKKLVEEQGFPVSKVNWKGMIDSIDDDRLNECTKHLDRSWLEGFDFSVSETAI